MVVTSIMTTEAIIKSKVGANVSAAVTEAMYDGWVLEAESFVNTFIRINFSDIYAALNADVKYIFSNVVSCIVAIQGIMYDPSGYTNLAEAKAIVTILRDSYMRDLGRLKDKKNTTFITEA